MNQPNRLNRQLASNQVRLQFNKNTNKYSIVPFQEHVSFDRGFFITVKSIQLLRSKDPAKYILVSIAGPSGSGKSSLANKIIDVLPGTALLSLDNYLDTSKKVIDENFDDYRLFDFDLIRKNIKEITSGRSSKTPLYDFRKSGRYAWKTIQPPKNKVLIVEGTYALHDSISDLVDLGISISGGVHFDLIKRIFRDIRRTGQEPNEALTQITQTVYPMFKAFIEPDLQKAHIKIKNDFNPFQGLLNPMYTLKSAKKISPSQICQILDIDPKILRKESYYDIYLYPPGSIPTDCKDWIRVRNHNGQYSLMFSDQIKESGFIISPRFDFTVTVKVLGGLMALGYNIGAMLHRTSINFNFSIQDRPVVVSLDNIHQLRSTFIQVKGRDRHVVWKTGEMLGLKGHYIDKSYIELLLERFHSSDSPSPNPIYPGVTDNTNRVSSFLSGKGNPFAINPPKSSSAPSQESQKADLNKVPKL